MRRYLKLFLFLIVSFIFLVVIALFRLLWSIVQLKRLAIQARITQVWAKVMLMIIGIRIEKLFHHQQFRQNHYLIVSNHQSYIDIIVIASLFPTLFVAKREVKEWFLLGWLASLGGTVFIDRQAFRGGIHSAHEVSSVLDQKVNVNIFPEGTSSDGTKVFPFKPSLLKAAIDSQTSVLPLSINYLLVNGKPLNNGSRNSVCWYGEMEFIPHFWNLLAVRSILAAVITHRIITPAPTYTPQQLSQQSYDSVSSGLIHISNVTPQQKILMQELFTAEI